MNPRRTSPHPLRRATLLLAALPTLVSAQAPAPGGSPDRAARTWAATCLTCHSNDQRAPGAIPLIAGRDAETLYRTLLEFKNGQRPAATVMHQHAKGYSDDELRRIAQALAAPASR
ncbi:c-type cytochrome [Leptothrix sp. BB-4]